MNINRKMGIKIILYLGIVGACFLILDSFSPTFTNEMALKQFEHSNQTFFILDIWNKIKYSQFVFYLILGWFFFRKDIKKRGEFFKDEED